MQETAIDTSLEKYFEPFRKNIVGYNKPFNTPYGEKKLVYADWTASGRLYKPIEDRISHEIGPYLGNTHTETSMTGMMMTNAYHEAQNLIKRHVNAGPEDIIINEGSGMTGVINKFQRILGLKVPEKFMDKVSLSPEERPVVFVTHMEHHSNHTSWLETIADVECIMPDEQGLINLDFLEGLLNKYKSRKRKIASVTACSNVTGIETCYKDIARLMHQYEGLCFVDFAASAPYVNIDMHPDDPLEKLDAVYFSPHKFLGGPGTPGILVFDKNLYTNKIPDEPGGGTVWWTNPWGGRHYLEDIEAREDGGTPPFLQTIKAALAIRLKEKMGVDNIIKREHEIVAKIFNGLDPVENLHILAGNHKTRLGMISFYLENIHYDLVTRLLNDRYGIQMRGGCSCAGTYGHYLLHIDQYVSKSITDKIDEGDLSEKPGWVRMSIHPTMTDQEIDFIIESIGDISENAHTWQSDYNYDAAHNTFQHKSENEDVIDTVKSWFKEI